MQGWVNIHKSMKINNVMYELIGRKITSDHLVRCEEMAIDII